MAEVPVFKLMSSDTIEVTASEDLAEPAIVIRTNTNDPQDDQAVVIPLDRVERVVAFMRATAKAMREQIADSPEEIAVATHVE